MSDYSYGGAYADWQAELRASARPRLSRKVVPPGRLDGGSRRRRDHFSAKRRTVAGVQAVTANVAVRSAVELPPTQTSNVEGSRTQSRSAAFQ
jgi:hypothetical protein